MTVKRVKLLKMLEARCTLCEAKKPVTVRSRRVIPLSLLTGQTGNMRIDKLKKKKKKDGLVAMGQWSTRGGGVGPMRQRCGASSG